MAYFPLFIELEAAPCLVVGGGHVALRKVQKLLPYGPKLKAVAPDFLPAFRRLEKEAGLELHCRGAKETDMPMQNKNAGKMVSENPIISSLMSACSSQWGMFFRPGMSFTKSMRNMVSARNTSTAATR